MDSNRKAFEERFNNDTRRHSTSGGYLCHETAIKWKAWQIAMSTCSADYQTLRDEINNQWYRLYQGEPVEDITQLRNRIIYIANDRDCWVFNTKMADKQVKELEEKLDAIGK